MSNNLNHFDKLHALNAAVIGFEFEFFSNMVRGRIIESLSKLLGKKVNLIDESIIAALTVGTINSMYYNTNLYSHEQYQAVNSKTWASKAYVMNEVESLCV